MLSSQISFRNKVLKGMKATPVHNGTEERNHAVVTISWTKPLWKRFEKCLKALFAQGYPKVKISFVFRTIQRIANLFHYKDTVT